MKLRRHIYRRENARSTNIVTAIIIGSNNCTKISNIEQITDNSSLISSTTNSSIGETNDDDDNNILINSSQTSDDDDDDLYHQSVTLTARMWPPVELGPPSTIWGLPVVIWGIIIGCLIIALIISITLFFCYWILPRRNKILSPTRFCDTNSGAVKQESTMSHRSSSSMIAKNWNNESGHIIVPISVGLIPSQYNNNNNNNLVPSPTNLQQQSSLSSSPHQTNHHNYHQHSIEHQYSTSPAAYGGGSSGIGVNVGTVGGGGCGVSISPGESKCSIPETHKSMWVINPLHGSNTVLSEHDVSFKSRSLPSWGKSKQRPISTTDDLEELYAKVNFSKKRRNRMRNDEAAIIALCRSRSQNLAGLPLEREGVVIYDERTAL